MEAQGDPFRRGLPTLQTSLTLPELPCTATAGMVGEDFLRFEGGGCRAGKFLVDWEVGFFTECGYRACLVGNEMRILPSSVAYGATFPLEGEGLQ